MWHKLFNQGILYHKHTQIKNQKGLDAANNFFDYTEISGIHAGEVCASTDIVKEVYQL